MLLKVGIFCCLALLVAAENSIESTPDAPVPIVATETRVEHSVSFETSHKRPDDAFDHGDFQTSHKIAESPQETDSDSGDFKNLPETMNLLPTKERPELNPVLSVLINEDVMKSIEAKRAIEQAELEIIKAEADAAIELEEEEKQLQAIKAKAEKEEEQHDAVTEGSITILTTAKSVLKAQFDLDDDLVGFVDQPVNLDEAGSENNKKSRIEIKKGPNGQDYEYEYVYYYEDEDDNKAKPAVVPVTDTHETRGKSRYTNIERSTAATPSDNALVSGKAKGRSSSGSHAADIEVERLPTNTRFPSRGKHIDVHPTPALDSLENAAEKKRISLKRPSLELVDSETFNTDEKQAKGTRNGDTEAKPVTAIAQEQAEQAAAVAAASKSAEKSKAEAASKTAEAAANEEDGTESDSDLEQTTQSMEKAALDLYAILANENFNMEMTTDADSDATTTLPDTTNADGEDGLTTLVEEEPSSTTSTTTTTTTTEAPTTTTTTTTTVAPLYGGRRTGLGAPGRNRFKLKQGGAAGATASTTTTTTEAPAPSEVTKPGRNRFSRPAIGGRNRPRTTAAPPAAAPAEKEEEVVAKEVKPVSSAFGRGRPRNRFNLRGSTTTEKPDADAGEEQKEEAVSSTTARSLRARPTLNLRGRSRTTTTKAPVSEDEASADGEAAAEEKPAAPVQSSPSRPSRFNLNRAGGTRLLPRTKNVRTTEAPAAEDSADDSDAKAKGQESGEKTEEETAGEGGHSLKSRPRLSTLHKTEIPKPKAVSSPAVPRKINPLLAKRRLQLGQSTTETAPVEEDASPASEEAKDETAAPADDAADSAKDDTTEASDATTKQPRGLGLLGQRRRLPLRKPGTIL